VTQCFIKIVDNDMLACLNASLGFEETTWGGDTVALRYQETVSALWASVRVTTVPSVVASSAFLSCLP